MECTFCGRAADEVLTFFRPGTHTPSPDEVQICICNYCVESCHNRLEAKRDETLDRVGKQKLKEALSESATDTLIRAILENDYRELFIETFRHHADHLARLDPDSEPEPAALQLMPGKYLRENRILPWRIENGILIIAFYNPLHMTDIYDEVCQRAGMPIQLALLPRKTVLACIEKHFGGDE